MKLGSLFLVIILGLSGCSVLGPIKADQPTNYVINAIPKSLPSHSQHAGVLLITMPETAPAYNTNQMVYSSKPFQLGYFSQNQWAETPGQMLFPLMIQALENRHYYRSVVGAPYGGRIDYILNTHIIALQQNYTCKPATLRLVISAQLNSAVSNDVIAIKQFVINVPLKERNPYSGVMAANEATVEFLKELITFTESHR